LGAIDFPLYLSIKKLHHGHQSNRANVCNHRERYLVPGYVPDVQALVWP
jgi:hypothetical protein